MAWTSIFPQAPRCSEVCFETLNILFPHRSLMSFSNRFNRQPTWKSKPFVGLLDRVFFWQPHVAFKCLTTKNSVSRFFPGLRKLERFRRRPTHGFTNSSVPSSFIIREFRQFNSCILLIPHNILPK